MTTTRSKTITLRSKLGSNSTLFEYPDSEDKLEPGKNVITFTKHDFNQLRPAKFLNDTIIYFFMQYYLDNEVSVGMKNRIHVFNSFFFAKIRSIHQRKAISQPSYEFASRWLKNVGIFEKDFLIIPVCEKDHWLLVVVCYAANYPQKRTHLIPDEDLYEPAVIVLNSCKGLAPPIKRALGQFLSHQWTQERGVDRLFPIHNAKKTGIKLLFPEMPQQKNSFDCGVYILAYFYSFLRDPRKAYIKMFRGHSMKNWFLDNSIDISRERRKMLSFVKQKVSQWREAYPMSDEYQTTICGNDNNESQEIHILTSRSEDDSSSDSFEGTRSVEIVEQIMIPSSSSLSRRNKTKERSTKGGSSSVPATIVAKSRRGTVVIN